MSKIVETVEATPPNNSSQPGIHSTPQATAVDEEDETLQGSNTGEAEFEPLVGRIHSLIVAGEIGKGFSTFSQSVLQNGKRVSVTDENLEEILRLFPKEVPVPQDTQARAEFYQSLMDNQSNNGSSDQQIPETKYASVLASLATARLRSATGVTLWRAEYVRDPKLNGSAAGGMQELAEDLAGGKLPPEALPLLASGRAIFFVKPNGSYRPIIIPDFMTKMGASMLFKKLLPKATQILSANYQYGIGVPASCEFVVSSVRAMLQNQEMPLQGSGRKVALLLDCTNAFMSIDRNLILVGLKRYFPAALEHFNAHYPTDTQCAPAKVQIRMESGEVKWINTVTGVFPGEPCGPFYFAVGLHVLLQRVVEICGGPTAFDDAFLAAILDDITLVAEPNLVVAFLAAFKTTSRVLGAGLNINMPKSKVFPATPQITTLIRAHQDAELAQITLVPEHEGVILLGSPIGSDDFCRHHWLEEVGNITVPVIEALARYPNVQDRMLMARFCVATRSTMMMRSAHPTVTAPAAEQVDAALKLLIQSTVVDDELTEDMWKQASLPLRYGGAGITSAVQLGKFAYVSAVATAINSFQRTARLNGSEETRPLSHTTLMKAFENFYAASPSITSPPTADVQSQEFATSEAGGHDPGGGQQHQEKSMSVADLHKQFIGWVEQEAEKYAGSDPHRRKVATGLPLTQKDLQDIPTGGNFTAFANTQPKLQHRFANLSAKIEVAKLRAGATIRDAARLVSVAQKGATAFMEAVPSDNHLVISNDVYRHAMSMLLGSPKLLEMHIDLAERCSACGGRQDKTKYGHRENCKVGGAHIHRHDAVKHVYRDFCRSHDTVYIEEPRAVYKHAGQGGPDGRGTRPDGVNFIADVAITNPINDPALSARVPLSAASKVEESKIQKWLPTARDHAFLSVPFVMETTGAVGPKSLKFMNDIIMSFQSQNPGAPVPTSPSPFNSPPTTWAAATSMRYWLQRFSITAARGSYNYSKVVEFKVATTGKPSTTGINGRAAPHNSGSRGHRQSTPPPIPQNIYSPSVQTISSAQRSPPLNQIFKEREGNAEVSSNGSAQQVFTQQSMGQVQPDLCAGNDLARNHSQ